jgi:hypothetical protein
VHEGKPLYGDDNDHSMEEAERQTASFESISRRQQPVQTSGAPSSLAKAAGGVFPIQRRPHISSKLVIDNHSQCDNETSISDGDAMACSPPRAKAIHPPPRKAAPLRTRLIIGGEHQNHQENFVTHPQHQLQQQQQLNFQQPQVRESQRKHLYHYQPQHYKYETVERMEGVEHHGLKGPLVVMDGANIAYAYADALSGFQQGSSSEPDARGIQVAAQYFLATNVRVLVVIPAPWFRAKPRVGDESQGTYCII